VEAVIIRRIRSEDAGRLRHVRLRSLRTDPDAFYSTLAREAAYSDKEWLDWAAGSADGDETATLVALNESGEAVGIVGAHRDDAEASLFHVIAMWVAPDCRGHGLGRRLLTGIEEWIASAGGLGAQLDVADSASAAAALYATSGYEADGHRFPSPHAPGVTLVSLRKPLV
jgi:ribosomal protein S18 acetylase RimI-like enzyme